MVRWKAEIEVCEERQLGGPSLEVDAHIRAALEREMGEAGAASDGGRDVLVGDFTNGAGTEGGEVGESGFADGGKGGVGGVWHASRKAKKDKK